MKINFHTINKFKITGDLLATKNNQFSGDLLLWLYSYLFSSEVYKNFNCHHKIIMIYVPMTKYLPKGKLTDKRLYHQMVTRTR